MYLRSAITISLWHETEHGIVCMQIITHVLIISKISLNKRRLGNFFLIICILCLDNAHMHVLS